MLITEYAPGKSCGLQLTDGANRFSTVWGVFSAKRGADMYVAPRMLGGAVKVSLHQSGSWQAGLADARPAHRWSNGSRHWDIWKRGPELAPGTVRGWYLLIPNQELRTGPADGRAHRVPPVGDGHAVSIEFLMMTNQGPTVEFDDTHIIGRWVLCGRDESCLLIARRIPWPEEVQVWANAARSAAAAQLVSAGFKVSHEDRYYIHGYNAQGVRFGLELAAV
jgi:hypothetical protein